MPSILHNLFDFSKSPVLNFFRGKTKYVLDPNVYSIPKNPNDERIIDACKILVMNWDEKGTGLSGEAKRHQVYAKLIKIYPNEDRKRLALLIELVISKCV